MFHIYDKRIYKRDVTCSLPSPFHKLSHLLGPHPPSSATYFMDGPKVKDKANSQLARSYARLTVSGVNQVGQGETVLPKVLTGGTAVLTPPKVQTSEGQCRVLLHEIS